MTTKAHRPTAAETPRDTTADRDRWEKFACATSPVTGASAADMVSYATQFADLMLEESKKRWGA